ncbi:ABC transporter permease subunit [Nocardia sp. NPDC051756]|uniref:ABC transporter permease subunit n=1 Tax=Nocardia sp. NPDC051756 TaxID=3154751 RepID=UPI0034384755
MTVTILAKTLREGRRALIGWTAGITLAPVMYASFYPQMAKNGGQQVQNVPAGLREALRMDDIASAPGYLRSTVFGLIVPLLAMFFGAATGARATAADEESGTLDLLMSYPITRTTLILQRFGALAVAAATITAVLWLGMLAIRSSAELNTDPLPRHRRIRRALRGVPTAGRADHRRMGRTARQPPRGRRVPGRATKRAHHGVHGISGPDRARHQTRRTDPRCWRRSRRNSTAHRRVVCAVHGRVRRCPSPVRRRGRHPVRTRATSGARPAIGYRSGRSSASLPGPHLCRAHARRLGTGPGGSATDRSHDRCSRRMGHRLCGGSMRARTVGAVPSRNLGNTTEPPSAPTTPDTPAVAVRIATAHAPARRPPRRRPRPDDLGTTRRPLRHRPGPAIRSAATGRDPPLLREPASIWIGYTQFCSRHWSCSTCR